MTVEPGPARRDGRCNLTPRGDLHGTSIMTLPPPSPISRPKAVAFSLRAIAIAWGAFSLYLAAQWFIDLGMVGFPDGYITPYAKATDLPLHILAWACTVQGVYFLARGVFAKGLTARGLCLQILAAAIVIVAPVLLIHKCPQSQPCNDAYLAITGSMLDDGTGG
jgi:hypothetical protein